MKLRKILTLITVCLLAVCILCSCAGGDIRTGKDKDASENFKESLRVFVNEESTGNKLSFFGVEIFPEMFMDGNITAEDRDVLVDRIIELGVDNIKIGINPMWYEPVNDNYEYDETTLAKFTFDSAEMKAFFEALSVANDAGLPITLVIRAVDSDSWLGCNVEGADVTSPSDVYELAENIKVILKYIDMEMKTKYSNTKVEYLSLQDYANENWINKDGTCIPTYYTAVEEITKAISSFVFTEKPKLLLSNDNTNDTTWFKRNTEKLSQYAGAYAFHTDFLPRNATVTEIFDAASKRAELVANNDAGKPIIANTVGFSGERPFGVEEYNDAVNFSVFVEQLLLGGVSGMIYRNLCDYTYNGVTYSDGLLSSKTEGFGKKTMFNLYSLLAKTLNEGDEVFGVELYDYNEDTEKMELYTDVECSCVAIKCIDGSFKYLFTNCGRLYNKQVTIFTNQTIESVTGTSCGEKGIKDMENIQSTNGKIYISVPATSFSTIICK